MSTPNPQVPLTLEGASVLHQMFHLRRDQWRALDAHSRHEILREAGEWLERREASAPGTQSAAFAMLGHKGDLMLVHFRRDFAELLEAQVEVKRLRLADHLDLAHSYLSVVELGLYESTRKVYEDLAARGLEEGSEAWEEAIRETLDRQRQAMSARLWPAIPPARYICFYPMDRKRGEAKNWYTVPFGERQRMMHEHGLVGRKYGGEVRQIISGSIGLDDWEWGVDLFAGSPLPFKQLIYEMRFDEVSAVYAHFGPFFIGLRVPPGGLAGFLPGEVKDALG
jgi:chlorite dismutase